MGVFHQRREDNLLIANGEQAIPEEDMEIAFGRAE
jgi:hypothetical protein